MIGSTAGRLGAGSAAGLLTLLVASALPAQTPSTLAQERSEFQRWLVSSAVSPLRAIALMPVGDGLRLGPAGTDIPLPDLPEHRVLPSGSATRLESPEGQRPLASNRPIRIGDYTLLLAKAPQGPVLTVYGGSKKEPPGYYPYDAALEFVGELSPPEKSGKVRVLGPDGIEREASEAGSVLIPIGGGIHLRVLRLPGAGEEESELEIFFRDETNGRGTYPAGRFVSLVPAQDGKYRLDFNRARNPFCAYSEAFPCPAPWSGNALRVPVRAGERYVSETKVE